MLENIFVDVARARSYLNKLFMRADDDWLQGCVEFFRNEPRQDGYTGEELNNMVRDQWMLCDLREMCSGSLPSKLAEQIKVTITGSYVLQMNYLINVAAPAYQQLQKSKKVDTTNIEVTINENDTTKSASSHRLLKLYLTDGTQDVTAIEYKPMRNLNCDLIPGVKLLIKGPIECRRGALLLEEKNVTILGGEVDSLIGVNCFENILARTIGIAENNGRHSNHPALEFTRDVINPVLDIRPQNNHREVINIPELQDLNEADFVDDDDLDIDQIAALENQLLFNLDSEPSEQNADPSFTNINSNKSSAKPSMMPKYEWLPPQLEADEKSPVEVLNTADADMSRFLNEEFEPEYEDIHMKDTSIDPRSSAKNTIATSVQSSTKPMSNYFKPLSNTNNRNTISLNSNCASARSNNHRTEFSIHPPKKLKIVDDENFAQGKTVEPLYEQIEQFTEKDFTDSVNEPMIIEPQPSTSHSTSKCRVNDSLANDKSIFTISEVSKIPEYVKKSRSFLVKSRIKTPKGKLKFTKDGWVLKCVLDDGTGLLDVDFSNEILSDMLGYSPAEMTVIKREAKVRPDLKEKVMKTASWRLGESLRPVASLRTPLGLCQLSLYY